MTGGFWKTRDRKYESLRETKITGWKIHQFLMVFTWKVGDCSWVMLVSGRRKFGLELVSKFDVFFFSLNTMVLFTMNLFTIQGICCIPDTP